MNSQLNIQEVTPSDNAKLARVIRSVFEEYNAPKTGTVYSDPTTDSLFESFKKTSSILWVAKLNHVIVGCCGVYPTPELPIGCAELVKFYLAKDARGRGIGKALMEKSIQSAKDFGYNMLYLESLPEFSTAVSMYNKLGFRQLHKPLGNSGHHSCNIWMILDL